MYVTYTDTLDNGMGLTFNISASGAGHVTDIIIDTGVGTIGLGDGADSAVDSMDGNAAINSLNAYGPRFSTGFLDGDTLSGASISYTSPSVNGWTAKVTRGMATASTASTAGSCINNYSDVADVEGGQECATGYTRLTGSAAVEGREAVMSVSYTHLTLPTKA